MGIISKTGGLIYHYNAWRFKKLWQPFLNDFSQVSQKFPKCKTLVLLAPSAGYLLPREFVASFENVVCYDIDPVARMIFKKRHKHPNLQYVIKDLVFHDGQVSIKPMEHILHNHPDSFFLFCNYWGQIPLVIKQNNAESIWKNYLNELLSFLKYRQWASFHELFSGYDSPIAKMDSVNLNSLKQPQQIFWGKSGVLSDHLLNQNLNIDSPRHYMQWQRLPNYCHLIETTGQNW